MGDPTESEYVVYSGHQCAIVYGVDGNGKMPAREYLEGKKSPLDKSQLRKFSRLFRRMADYGYIGNTEQFNSERGKIYAFKIWKHRIYCFRDGHKWVLANGCQKTQNKAKPKDLDRAERIMNEHIARKSKRT